MAVFIDQPLSVVGFVQLGTNPLVSVFIDWQCHVINTLKSDFFAG
jgi:hypothetical protein